MSFVFPSTIQVMTIHVLPVSILALMAEVINPKKFYGQPTEFTFFIFSILASRSQDQEMRHIPHEPSDPLRI